MKLRLLLLGVAMFVGSSAAISQAPPAGAPTALVTATGALTPLAVGLVVVGVAVVAVSVTNTTTTGTTGTVP